MCIFKRIIACSLAGYGHLSPGNRQSLIIPQTWLKIGPHSFSFDKKIKKSVTRSKLECFLKSSFSIGQLSPNLANYLKNIYIFFNPASLLPALFCIASHIVWVNKCFHCHTYCMYSASNNYLIPCWFCRFAHLQRMELCIILIIGTF